MSLDPDLRELLAPMIEREVAPDDAAFRVDGARVRARMNQARRPEPRAWRGVALVAAACAAVFVLVFVVGVDLRHRAARGGASLEVLVSEGSVTQVRGASRAVLGRSARIVAEGELETAADSEARVRTSDGLEIELRARTRVGLDEVRAAAHRVKLLGGVIRCTVPHRDAARAFEVVTSDVTVVDVGTIFTVSVEEPAQTTRVSVEEGEVLVRHASGETHVRAPGSWSSAPGIDAPPVVVPAARAAPAPSGSKGGHALVRHGELAPPGTLAQESELLRQGLAAERHGRVSESLAALRELLARYPGSPLAADARAALTRVEAGAPP